MLTFFGVERGRNEEPVDVWPMGLAPFIRLSDDGGRSAKWVCDDGLFGLLPHFQTEVSAGRRTYNARSETVATLASFRRSWKEGRRCIIPAEAIYEPCYETGNAVRWQITGPGGTPLGVAGIYTRWQGPDGRVTFTFAMLTVNADGHPVFGRMHKPGEEKRMVVLLDPKDYGEWLTCPVDQAARFFRRWEGPLEAQPNPLPPRPPRATGGRIVRPPSPPEEPELF